MEYNYNRREVYMPEKYHISKRYIQLTPKENEIFSLLWSRKDKSATYQDLCQKIYNDENMTEYDKSNIRRLIHGMKKKGIKILAIYGYGYKLGGN